MNARALFDELRTKVVTGFRSAANDPTILRELAPLSLVILLSPWLYLALKNYRDAAVFRDVNMFNYGAFCIRKGERMYDTIATPDGPLIYWLTALFQTIADTDAKLQRRLDIDFHATIGALLGLLVTPRAAVRAWLRRIVWALLGAMIWVAWVIEPDFPATLQRESYYVGLGSLAFALVYASEGRRVGVSRAMLLGGGFLAGLDMFGKHTGLLYVGLAVMTAILLQTGEGKHRRRFNIGWVCAGVAASVAMVFGYLLFFGSIRGFVFWYFKYDLEVYRFFNVNNVSDMIGNYRVEIYNWVVGVLVVGIAGIVLKVLPPRSLAFALAPALNAIANVAQLHGWHYQLVPVIATTYLFYLYVLAMAWNPPTRRFGPTRKIAAIGIIAIVVPLFAKQVMSTPWIYPKEKQLVSPDIVDPRDAGDYVAVHTQSTDRVLYYGGNPAVPFYAKRLPATPYMVTWMLNFGQSLPEAKELDVSHKPTEKQKARILELQALVQADACRRVTSNPPAAMVFEVGPGFGGDAVGEWQAFCPPLVSLMQTSYHAAATFGGTRIFLRSDRD